MMTNVTFRNVNEDALTEFRAEAAKLKKNLGEAITEAIQLWLFIKKKKLDVMSLENDPLWAIIENPVDFGEGTENLSQEVDKIVYGE